MEEAQNLCDYIVIMDSGVILKEGTINELLEEDTNEKIVEFTTESILDEDLTNGPFKIHTRQTGERSYVSLTNFETDLPAFMAFLKSRNITLKHMECHRRTLDDLFTSLTGRRINE
jgi:ABC-2 type transport system ATP-binding protein